MDGQRFGGPRAYEIRLKGHLDARRARMFEGLEMVQEPGGETVLTGIIIDQAALHGVLDRIRDLGVPLLSVRQVPAASSRPGRARRESEGRLLRRPAWIREPGRQTTGPTAGHRWWT